MEDGGKPERKKYTLLLLLLCVFLALSLVFVFVRAGQERASPGAETLAETATESPPSETIASAAVTFASREEGTTPESLASPGGELQSERVHWYVRAGHEISVSIEHPGIEAGDLHWSTDNETVATAENGILYGHQPGECNLTVEAGGAALTMPVTVRELTVENGCTYVDGILVANKSYSLPESYDPGMLPVTEDAFTRLSEDAAKEGLDIYIGSGYRDYQFQVEVYQSMVDGYGQEYADALSARPGHSEHQTGYTVDCNTIDDAFGETKEGKWLAAHCHEYGFIIRYPKGKEDITGYAYESWHIRYVGEDAARDIFEQGLTLEEYLDIDSVYPPQEEENEKE